MKFVITEFIKKFMKVGDEYQYVEVEKKYTASTWDDLNDLLMTLIDFAEGSIKFEVKKEKEAECNE